MACVVGGVLLRRALPHEVQSSRPGFATQSWLRSALPMMLISGVWAANNYVGTLVVGTLDGTRAAGIYSVVEKGAGLIVVFLLAANMPLAPAVARLHARGDRRGLEHATERIAQVTLLASAPVALAFALFPGHLFGHLWSEAFWWDHCTDDLGPRRARKRCCGASRKMRL